MTEAGSEIERFFRQIVRTLAATDPARLHRPLPLADIRDSIVPYRANRRALQIESSEDYELILLRLLAGEGGYARTEPDDVRVLFAEELRSSNPELGILHRHENAVVSLESQPLKEALNPQGRELAFAPPNRAATAALPGEASTDLPELSLEPPGAAPVTQPDHSRFISHCAHCGGELPAGRVVNFCPHCGGPHAPARCPACRSEIEAGWRHCVTCGAAQ